MGEIKLCNCGHAMIRAEFYDPEGTIPLFGGLKEYEDGKLVSWFVCINPACGEGRKNIKNEN